MMMMIAHHPLQCSRNDGDTPSSIKLVHCTLMVGCYDWYSGEGTGWGAHPPIALLAAVANVTARFCGRLVARI